MCAKRVLNVLGSLERSGLEKMLLCSSREWVDEGYRCDILATAPKIGPLYDDMIAAGYAVHHLPFRSSYKYLPSGKFLLGYFRLCRSGYDIVHIHTEAASLMFALLAWACRVPRIVLTPHNTFRFRGLLRARKFVERFVMRTIGCQFAMISNDVKECEWDRYRNTGRRVHNWMDTDHYRPPTDDERVDARRRLEIRDGCAAIVSVGNCNAAKNHQALIRALALVSAEYEVVYLHIGREAPDGRERELCQELGLSGIVRFLGSQSDPRTYLWASDVFVMPSLYEGVGISALEAVAVGLPVVLAEVPGLREVAGVTKAAVKTTTDPDSIALGIVQVLQKSVQERLESGRLDSDSVRVQFSARRGVESIVRNLYDPSGVPVSDDRL